MAKTQQTFAKALEGDTEVVTKEKKAVKKSMKLTKEALYGHFRKTSISGIKSFIIDTDGSFITTDDTKQVIVSAPALVVDTETLKETYESENPIAVFDIEMLLNMIKTLTSTDGVVNVKVTDTVMLLKTSRLSYEYVLADPDSLTSTLNPEKAKQHITSLAFGSTFTLSNIVIRNILQVLNTLKGDRILLTPSTKGVNFNIGGSQLHKGIISVDGKVPMHLNEVALPASIVQDVLKIVATEVSVTISITDDGSALKVSTTDGYDFYIQALEKVVN